MSVVAGFGWRGALAPAGLGLAALVSLVACEGPPAAQASPPEAKAQAKASASGCESLEQYVCSTCGSLSEVCRTIRRQKGVKSERCTKSLARIKSMLGHPPLHYRYCSFAAWIVQLHTPSDDHIACRRYRFDVCRSCGKNTPACKSLQTGKSPGLAACKSGLKVWQTKRPPSIEPYCRLLGSGKAQPAGGAK